MKLSRLLFHGTILVILVAMVFLILSKVDAATIYACKDGSGKITFSDTDCGTAQQESQTIQVDTPNTGWNSRTIVEQNLGMLDSFERRLARQRTDTPIPRGALTYWDRSRLREISIERGALRDQLKRIGGYGLGNFGKAGAISRQIRSLDEEALYIRGY